MIRSTERSRIGHGRAASTVAAVALAGVLVGSGVGATTVPDDTTATTAAATTAPAGSTAPTGSDEPDSTSSGDTTTPEDTSATTATDGSGSAAGDPCNVSAPTDPMSTGPTGTAPTGTATDDSATGAAGTAVATTAGADATTAGADATDATRPAPTAIDLTLTETSIDGLPADLPAGVADVTVSDETASSGGEVNFTLVEPGTDPAAFAEGLSSLFEGGPFPEFFLNTSGTTGGMITLAEGEYIVWIDLAADEERPTTADDIIAAPLTVAAGDPMPVIPGTNDRVRSGDYLFDADIVPCDTTITFTNSSDNQFHHVIVVDFGTNDPVLVEQNLPAVLESGPESAPPPGIDMSQVNFEFANSGVFGPGASGTFEADFVAGNTYALLCFIQDRQGGAPHAIQHQMYDVITIGG